MSTLGEGSARNRLIAAGQDTMGYTRWRPEVDHGIAGLAAEKRSLTLRHFAIPLFA
jgi:hypothetical protein